MASGQELETSRRREFRRSILIWGREVLNRSKDLFEAYPKSLQLKLLNSIRTALINIINNVPFFSCIYEMISFVSSRTDISKDALLDICCQDYDSSAHIELSSLDVKWFGIRKRWGKIIMEYSTKGTETQSNNSVITLSLPGNKIQYLLDKGNSEDIVALVENYHFLSVDSSFFWSIHPDVYRAASLGCSDVIEGFASPFNFNLPQYCSLFETDKVFGSIGNFFEVIQSHVSDSNRPTRWIINPPYTNSIINLVTDEVKARLERYPHDEYIFLLPRWNKLELVDLVQRQGIGRHLKASSYRIYDHVTATDVHAPIAMFFGYLKGSSRPISYEDRIFFENLYTTFSIQPM